MDHGQNVKVSNVQLSPLQRIKISFACWPCKLYVEQSLLFSLFLKKIIFNVFMLMDVFTFRWVTVIAKYLQRETVADFLYATCFCNVYAVDTNKVYKVAFWLSSGFYSAIKALSTPLPCIMIIVLLEPAFLFFVLTSGRPLPVTTFFVFSKPICSHFAVQIVMREFSASLQQRCLSLSKGFPLQHETAKIY